MNSSNELRLRRRLSRLGIQNGKGWLEDAGVLIAIKCRFTSRVAVGQVGRVAACLVEILRDLRFGNSTVQTLSLL